MTARESASATAFLLDLDGTLYQGGGPIPGAPDLLEQLRERGTPFRLVTNTSSRPRSAILERLARYGFRVKPDEVFTSIRAGAALSQQLGFQRLLPLIRPAALEDLPGFILSGGTSGRPADGPVDAVLVGDLGESWNWAFMQEAFERIMEGAALIALSRDRYWRRDDRLVLDLGPFVAGLEYACGATAQIAGKPSRVFYDLVAGSLDPGGDMPRGAIAMVGDDVWSDVGGAQQAGLQGWLVRTGKFREDALVRSGVTPDRLLDSVTGLLQNDPDRT